MRIRIGCSDCDGSMEKEASYYINLALERGLVRWDEEGYLAPPVGMEESDVLADMEQARQDYRLRIGPSSTGLQERLVLGFCLKGNIDHRERWGEFRKLLGLPYNKEMPDSLWEDIDCRDVAREVDATYRNRRGVQIINGTAIIESIREQVEIGVRDASLFLYKVAVRGIEKEVKDLDISDFRIASEILRSKWGRAKIANLADKLTHSVATEVDIAEVTREAIKEIEVARGILAGRMGEIHSFASVKDVWSQIEEVMARDKSEPVPTGIAALDVDIQGGVKKNDAGKMHLIGSRTGVGKSMLAIAAATGLVCNGAHVLFLSCELNQTEIGARFLSNYARRLGKANRLVDARLLQQWRLEGRGKQAFNGRIAEAYAGLMNCLIEDEANGAGSFASHCKFLSEADDFVEMIRSAKHQNPQISAVFLDHFHAMRPTRNGPRDRSQEMELRAQILHSVSKECEVDLFLLCQLNREAAIAPEGPALQHINGTDVLAQLASAVWLLEYGKRPDAEGKPRAERSVLQIVHGKHRNGQQIAEQNIDIGRSELGLDRDFCWISCDDTLQEAKFIRT